MNEQKISNRYKEADLSEFKALIEKKSIKTQEQLASLEAQLADTAESKDNEGDWMDDSSLNTNIEMLEVMVNRQRKHLMDLQNALQRIHNKSYGLCIITGELIDKRRLLAVPTTTKSLAAKMNTGSPAKKATKSDEKPKASNNPKIISRIVRKPKLAPDPKVLEEDEDNIDTDSDLGYDDMDFNTLEDMEELNDLD